MHAPESQEAPSVSFADHSDRFPVSIPADQTTDPGGGNSPVGLSILTETGDDSATFTNPFHACAVKT